MDDVKNFQYNQVQCAHCKAQILSGPNKTKPKLNLAHYPVISPNLILAQPNLIALAQLKNTKKKLKKLATKVCHHPHLHTSTCSTCTCKREKGENTTTSNNKICKKGWL
ncbi:hypothetical protein V6Z11_A04G041500 [Gossypium hirsutum]